MKGHVKLELFDADTGELVESAEGENLVTNAVKYVIGMFMQCGLSASNFYPIYAKVLGGLMLFDNTLTASADNVYFPVEAHFIAGATRTTNSSNPMGGSYNNLESGFVNGGNGFKLVWDFSTAQANGTIKSLALTRAGDNTAFYSLYNTYYNTSSDSGVGTGRNISNETYTFLGFRNGYIYRYTIYTHHTETIERPGYEDGYQINIKYIRIVRSKANIVQHGVADAGGNVSLMNAYEAEIVADFDATIWKATSYQSNTYYCVQNLKTDKQGDYLYGTEPARNAQGESISGQYEIWKIAYDSWTISKYIITCNYNVPSFWQIYDGYGYNYNSSTHLMLKVDLNNGGNAQEIQIVEPSRIYTGPYIQYIQRNGLVYGYFGYYYNPPSSNYRYYGFLYYPDGTVLVNTNVEVPTSVSYFSDRVMSDKLVIINNTRSDSNNGVGMGFLGNYLGTIFNLSSAVTKTSSRTMKISYTLTN